MSVRRFLTIALIAAGVLPILVFGLAFQSVLRRHIMDDARSLSQSMLRTIGAVTGSSLLDGTRRDLPALLLLVERSPSIPNSAENELLKAFRLPHTEYSFLAFLDSMNRIEASSSPNAEGVLGSTYRLHAPLTPGSVSFSDPFSSPLTGVVVVEAAYSNGHRTILAFLDLGETSSKLLLVAQSPSDRLGVVDGEGRYLACSDPSRAQSLERVDSSCLVSVSARVKSEGVEYYALSKPVPGSAWRLLYLRSATEADAPMRAFLNSILALVAIALVGTAVISIFAWRTISTPLTSLVSRINLIAEGRYAERVEGRFSSEFMEIGRAFNAMADSIEKRDQELIRSEERYRLIFFRNRVPTLVLEPENGAIRDANDAALAYYGYGKERILGLSISDIDEAPNSVLEADILAAAEGGEGRFLSRHKLASGEIRDVELYASPVELAGKADLYCVVFDVTQRRIAEERMAKALEEKTLLLREVYHRVKNNLQIISSLLNLQAGGLGDEASLKTLQAAQDRVFAMSLAHELVYQMADLASIEVVDYAERLVTNLQLVYGAPEGSVEAIFMPMQLELERAIPFGLAFNELVSNAFKYAAPSPSAPVRIALEINDAGARPQALVSVEDSGPGLPEEVKSAGQKPGSLGLSLIMALAQQLGGEASWSSGAGGGGTRALLRFPLSEEKAPGWAGRGAVV
jgi:PAS domain S-box-containing protein